MQTSARGGKVGNGGHLSSASKLGNVSVGAQTDLICVNLEIEWQKLASMLGPTVRA